MSEFATRDEFRRWLGAQSALVCCWIGFRAAARVLPEVLIATKTGEADETRDLLTTLRALIIAQHRNLRGDPECGEQFTLCTTEFAKQTADIVGNSTVAYAAKASHLVAKSAVWKDFSKGTFRAIELAAAVYDGAFQESFDDACIYMECRALRDRALWNRTPPAGYSSVMRSGADETQTDVLDHESRSWPDGFGFWSEWYSSILTGQSSIPSPALRDVALILPDDWGRGAQHINNVVIPKLMAKYETPLAKSYPVDFTFDALVRVMRMIGIEDDAAHLRTPQLVQSFIDDAEEARDLLQDFEDYANQKAGGGNAAGVLALSAQKVLSELNRTRDHSHIRARRIVGLAHRLEDFSKNAEYRDDLGEPLSKLLDDAVSLLRSVTRKHFAPSYTALAPLSDLSLEHVDQDAVVQLYDEMIVRLEALPGDELVALDEDSLSVFRDMVREAKDFRAAIAEASTDEFRDMLEHRLAESLGGTGIAFGRFLETSSKAAGTATRATDTAIKQYRRVTSLEDIYEFIQGFLGGGGQ